MYFRVYAQTSGCRVYLPFFNLLIKTGAVFRKISDTSEHTNELTNRPEARYDLAKSMLTSEFPGTPFTKMVQL